MPLISPFVFNRYSRRLRLSSVHEAYDFIGHSSKECQIVAVHAEFGPERLFVLPLHALPSVFSRIDTRPVRQP